MNQNAESHVYAVIMAGGTCCSLWPLSRRKTPKQFVHFFDGETMIKKTVERISELVHSDNIYIITGKQLLPLIHEHLPEFNRNNIIVEPCSRDTAPCIALATSYIFRRDPDAVTIILPSDHLVFDERQFQRVILKGVKLAKEKRGLVTIGIQPDRPETRYGYIQVEPTVLMDDESAEEGDIMLFRVRTFAEKPDLVTAHQFLQSRDFWWNSGVFIWHVETICSEFKRSMPELYQDMQTIHAELGTEREQHVINDVYSWIHPISVDYGIMEKAEKVYMLAGNFGWTDLGCWDEVVKIGMEHPAVEKRENSTVLIDSGNVFVRKQGEKAVVAVGLQNVMIVDTPDALLVCSMGESQKVRKAVDLLRREGLEEYL